MNPTKLTVAGMVAAVLVGLSACTIVVEEPNDEAPAWTPEPLSRGAQRPVAQERFDQWISAVLAGDGTTACELQSPRKTQWAIATLDLHEGTPCAELIPELGAALEKVGIEEAPFAPSLIDLEEGKKFPRAVFQNPDGDYVSIDLEFEDNRWTVDPDSLLHEAKFWIKE